jgi:hypothetical protein
VDEVVERRKLRQNTLWAKGVKMPTADSVLQTSASSSLSTAAPTITTTARTSFAPVVEQQPNWNNLSVLHRNRLPALASFYNYRSAAATHVGDYANALAVSLSGSWKFKLQPSPKGYNFIDHTTPKPALAELQQALQPVHIAASPRAVTLTNQYDFAGLNL